MNTLLHAVRELAQKWRDDGANYGPYGELCADELAKLADRAEAESQREGQQGQWLPIESAPLGSFLAWIPSTNMAWPAWKENNGRIFSNAHGPLNELDYGDGRFIEATHWHEKLPPPETRT